MVDICSACILMLACHLLKDPRIRYCAIFSVIVLDSFDTMVVKRLPAARS